MGRFAFLHPSCSFEGSTRKVVIDHFSKKHPTFVLLGKGGNSQGNNEPTILKIVSDSENEDESPEI